MKHIKKTLIITLIFLSLELYAGWFSQEISICDKTDQVQMRGGRLYLPNQSDGFTGENYCEWKKNKQQSSRGDYSDGLKDGKWTEWYLNGQLESKGSYNDGKKDGKWTEWNSDGKKVSQGTYKDDEIDGEYKFCVWGGKWQDQYYVEGALYKNGKKVDGSSWRGDMSSCESDVSLYKRTRTVPNFTFDESKYMSDTLDKTPEELNKDARKSGWLKNEGTSEGLYKNGQKDGWWTSWLNEQKTSEGLYKDGQKDGLWTFWRSGYKKQEGLYKDGQKDGWWDSWDKDGEISETNYKDGKVVS